MKRILATLILALLAWAGIQPSPAKAETGDNLIANPSMETAIANGNRPTGWEKDKWGTNTANFKYLTTGHTGSRSVKARITSYTDGDAKWYFDPVTVAPDKSYTFSDYYKSNAQTEVVIEYAAADGTVSYQWLGSVVASAGWSQATFSFTAPADVQKATVLHVLPGVGQLTLDDASLNEIVDTTPTPAPNLVANPSAETAEGATPAKWLSSNWGTNTTAFTYEDTGRTGSKSLKTQITSYTDGDAKWYFEPVDITAGATYVYKDFYKADTETNVFAWFTKEDGSSAYQWLGTTPADTEWHEAAFLFKAPMNTKKVSIFHLVSGVGHLTIDDISLSLAEPPSSNPVPNASLEQPSPNNPNVPSNWLNSKWGSNTATFEYLNEGYVGSKSVKVTVSDYVDGDAKWYFEPQQLETGKSYKVSFRYRTNTNPQVVVMFLRADGSAFFAGLPKPLPSGSTTEWQLYSDTFSMPEDAVSATAFMFVASNGWAQTDDYLVESYEPVGFTRPLVSLTFDDGQEENAQNALPVMNAHGFKSTQCYATEFAEGNTTNSANILAFYNAGHEICSHTVTHPFLSQVNATQLAYELDHSKQFLEGLIGSQVHNFASPYGDYDAEVIDAVLDRYRSHRSVDEGYNSKDNFNVGRIRVQNMSPTTTIQEYQAWLDHAKETKTWLVLVYHRVASDPGEFDTYETDFTTQMQALADSGLTVKTYNDALDELLPQL